MAVPGYTWQVIDGWAIDIGVGGTGNYLAVYHAGTDQHIYQWDGKYGWKAIDCKGKAIAVGPDGALWFTGIEKGVFRRDGLSGQIREYGNARATDIGVDKNGVPWICYFVPGLSYKGIWRWNESASNWEDVGGYATRVSGGDGNAWHVGEDGKIYKWNNPGWKQIDGWAMDIGVGPNDEVWHIGTENRIYYQDNNRWENVFGDAKRIDVGPRGMPWVVTEKGWILRRVWY
jgi:hypothetical protein